MTLLMLLGACALSGHPDASAELASPVDAGWEAILAEPGPIKAEVVISARWEASLKGLLDLDDPAVREAGLENAAVPIVLVVGALVHPERGVFIVDTGVTQGHEGVRGLIRAFAGGVQVEEPLADILARQPAPLAGVLFTHMHLDHVLGLPDVPPGTPLYAGPGELGARHPRNAALRRTYRGLLEGHDPLRSWDFEDAPVIDGLPAIDVLGDGSLWALSTPGHTPGTAAYLANTTEGPLLFVGDNSHTRWGWERGVTPGTFTADHAANAESLARLRALSAAFPEMTVIMGHDLPGEGTGVEAIGGR